MARDLENLRNPRNLRISALRNLCRAFITVLVVATAAQAQTRLSDLDGRTVDPFQPVAGRRATAFVFTTTDCPIANRYAPAIRRLYETYRKQGIQFWLVYVNPRETADTIRRHAAQFELPLPALRDNAHDLVRQLGVTVTPEVALVDGQGQTLYRGRIDDRHAELGVDRPVATQHDFADALASIVAGRSVAAPTTRAVGCIISDFKRVKGSTRQFARALDRLAVSPRRAPRALDRYANARHLQSSLARPHSGPITFSRDVAPIVFDKCASCHRPGGAAPFSLLSYDDVRQRARQIVAVTERRYMPPWKANSDPAGFVGQKRLSDDDLAVLRRWVDDGVPEGDRAQLPSPPRFTEGWQLGTPDLVVTLPEAYALDAGPSDAFRIFVVPLPVSGTKYITGLEFQPGNPRVVHHANIRLDPTAGSRALDARDPAPGYDGLMARSAVYPEGHFLGWTPGQLAPLVTPDMAWRLEAGTDLVVQLHMQPSGARELVRPRIGLYFGDRPPTRTPTILRLGSQGIEIPAGDGRYTITDSYVFPTDVTLQAVQPHAHYRLKSAIGTATFPDGRERTLIRIDDWDFRWQHVYRYEQPIALPRGTRVSMRYTYDNSPENPRNPQVPPKPVHWGQRSFDEMGDLWLQVVADRDRDRGPLTEEITAKMTAEDVIGYETMLREDPSDAELHDDVAVLYLALGKAGDAVTHFRASATLKPESASAHFNLATALSVAGRLDEAVQSYRQALERRPDYAGALNNLGSVLYAQGRADEALEHFRKAVHADAGNVQAHRNVAWHLAIRATLTPDEQREAVAAGERAAALTSQNDPQVLEALGAAFASAGRFDRAVATVQRALTLTRDAALVATLRAQLALYQQNRPYRTK
jgi:Flp pilus assembly protein TadD